MDSSAAKLLSRDDTNKALSLLKTLEQKDECIEFLLPVDYQALGLDDYPVIIKTPMDLSTVKKKLKAGKYEDMTQVLADIQLIWDNCRTYNMSDSADCMEKHAKQACAKLKIDSDKGLKRPRDSDQARRTGDLRFEEKVDFCEKVKQASYEVLSRCVRKVQEQCPGAAETLDEEKIQIKVDLLDRDTFNALVDIVSATEAGSGTTKKARIES